MVSLLEASTLSKPHLRFKGGVWSCATCTSRTGWRVGFGYTPKEAYDDWRNQHA